MAKSNLYEYVILHHPKKKDTTANDEPAKSIIVQNVKQVLATTEQEVTILASRAIPEEYLDKLDQVEIRIRPF